jgi:predicted alpha/beta superfamily hydrolase
MQQHAFDLDPDPFFCKYALMRRPLIIFLFCITLISQANAQRVYDPAHYRITFLLYSPDLPDTSRIFITGGITQLGLWNPSKVPMKPEGNHRWSKDIVVDDTVSIEYKFTRGSWDTEAADDNGKPFQNFVVNVLSDTTVRINILFWRKGGIKRELTGGVKGIVKYHRQVEGTGLLPRDVIVWLPPDYEKNKKHYYPVLYMQDGQNIFDPSTSAFGNDWQIDESCDSLIRNDIIDPLIVVGIYNTADRSLEYTPGDLGDAYMRFITNKLKPMIDSSYRTLKDREHTFTGGSSAGGLISFMIAWTYPDVFSRAICMSPAFKIMNINFVIEVKETDNPPVNSFFYIYNGGVGLDSQLQPGVDAMLMALKSKNLLPGRDYIYIKDPSGKHSEPDWARHFPEAIIRCMAGK